MSAVGTPHEVSAKYVYLYSDTRRCNNVADKKRYGKKVIRNVIYIYIYIYKFVCVCVCVCVGGGP